VFGLAVTQNEEPALYHPFPGETVPAPDGLTDDVNWYCGLNVAV
jgi:hypothetical protein